MQIKQLFGNVQYTHETVGDTELMITYNSEAKSYIFPATPHVLPYTPKVEKVKKVDDSYVLTVGYIPPGLAWQGDVTGKKYEPEPEKIMENTLKENEKGEYQIYAVANAVTDGPSNTFRGGVTAYRMRINSQKVLAIYFSECYNEFIIETLRPGSVAISFFQRERVTGCKPV